MLLLMKEPVILFPNAGGLGDMLCAEPAFRYGINEVFTESEQIIIASNYRDFFQHLENDRAVVKSLQTINKYADRYRNYQIRKTFIDATTQVQGLVHQAMPVVDYSSLVCLQMSLPEEAKRIYLPNAKKAEKQSLVKKFSDLNLNLEKTLLLHPGVTWPSRTIPKNWWIEFISKMKNHTKLQLCQIGKSGIPIGVEILEGIPSLIDQLTLRELINAISLSWGLLTNDSLPIHIAGAFNKPLLVFSTFRPWYHLKPHNHPLAFNLVRKQMFPISWHRPTQNVARCDLVPENVRLEETIYSPEEVIGLINSLNHA